jgi:hypothetical protein
VQAPAQVPAKPPKPGLFAPKGEKELYNAIFKARSVAAIRAVGDTHPEFRIASYSLAGLMLLFDGDSAQAKPLLTPVFDQGVEPAVDVHRDPDGDSDRRRRQSRTFSQP